MKYKKISLGLATILSVAAPIVTVVACGVEETNNAIALGKLEGGILASFSQQLDILAGMGIKADAVADRGMGIKTPYLDKYSKGIKHIAYINTYATIDPVRLKAQGIRTNTLIHSGDQKKMKPYFKNLFKVPSSPSFNGKDAEELTMVFSDSSKTERNSWGDVQYIGKRKMRVTNFYQNWVDAADWVDNIYSQKDEIRTNDHKYHNNILRMINATKKRVTSIRNEISKIANRSLLIYNWGGKTQPGKDVPVDFNDLNHYQGPVNVQVALGSLLYSKKNGLGFDLPKFDNEKNIVITKTGWPTIKGLDNGNKQLQDSLINQNDYVIFDSQLYGNDTVKKLKSVVVNNFSKFTKNYSNHKDHFMWYSDSPMGTASYGPLGINHILDYLIDNFHLKVKKGMGISLTTAKLK